MRIALFSDDYLPNSTLVHAKMIHEMACELKKRGHSVVVITPGSNVQNQRLKTELIDNIEVFKFKTGTIRGVGKAKRAFNESMMPYNAWRAIRSKIRLSPIDLCINYSPSIFFGVLVRKIKKSNPKCKVYLILRDLFPQWAIDEGLISKNSLIASYFRFFESINYNISDVIGLMSEANIKYFKELHPRYENLRVLRNWAKLIPHRCEDFHVNYREKYNLKDKLIFFYGGNIGHAQDMKNLLRLVRSMQDMPQAHFLFVGQGDEYNLVKEIKNEWDLNNLTLLPSVSQDHFKEILLQIDIGLFSLAHSHKAHNFPGKFLGYMLHSIPILGSINPGNDLIKFINEKESGHAYINGEDEKLLASAKYLVENKSERSRLGENSYKVLEEYFSLDSAVNSILEEFK